MEDEKSSKAIRVQWFIPVVPCGSQLNYSIRSQAFQAKRSTEVPNPSFRLLVFKHRALHSSASPYSPFDAAFCATSQPLCSDSNPRCSLLLLPLFLLAWSCSHPPHTGPPFPRSPSQTLLAPTRPLLVPASWRRPVPVHYPSSSCHLRSLLLSLSMLTQLLLQRSFHPQLRLLSCNKTSVDALQPSSLLCLLPFLSPAQCPWLLSL